MEIVNGALTGIQLLRDISWTAISNCFNYRKILDEKIQKMKTKMVRLIGREEDINSQVRHETRLGGKMQKTEVGNWLEEVKDKKSEVQKLEEKAGKRRYLSRLRFLKLVDKATQEVAELTEQGRFPEGLLIDVHQDREMELLAPPLKGQTMRERNIMTIWERLIEDDIHTIGVYGMGGVGKTTILLDIHNKSKESATFDHVYWVTVSQESSIYKLQDGIAQVLNLDLSKETNERRRAATLSKELTERKKFVLILDDMWEVLAPENVGIPIGGVDGGKLIITTRSLEVCRRMNCQQQIIKVEPLSKEEAWDLFKATLQTVLAPEVQEIAKSVAEECAGLPLAIIVTAGSMKGIDDIREWRNAMEELREPTTKGINIDRENEVFKPLKFSYDRLNDEKLQQCLLYCALFPEDYKIRRVYLITCWIAEGLIDEMKTRQAEFDRGHALINKLENACLLERARDWEGLVCVKMHDVIRDMALSFTRVNSQFMVKAGAQLTELPAGESDWSENLERVSFMDNDIRFNSSSTSSILISPKCPRLRTLLLQQNFLFRIPHSLFVHMQNLRVLDLSYMSSIERLPDSISDLENLRALLLNGCWRLTYVPSLAKLTKLKDLHLHGISEYAKLPDGMGKLVSLKNLALSYSLNTSFWDEVELQVPNVNHHHLSHHLQSLIPCFVENDGQLKSLINLRKLEFLYVRFSDLHQFNSYVVESGHCQMLTCYYLDIDWHWTPSNKRSWDWDPFISREVTIRGCNLVEGGEGEGSSGLLLLLPNNILDFNIIRCKGLTSLSNISSSLKNATQLKRCSIEYCNEMENFWSFSISLLEEEEQGSEGYSNTDTPIRESLMTLNLQSLPNLSVIFKFNGVGAPPPKCGIFSNLKLLRVSECHKLKYLFPRGLVQHHLQNLEVIHVEYCDEMKKIIHEDKEEEEEDTAESNFHYNDSDYIITFPKLHTLALRVLPKLKSIWSGTLVCHSLQQIGIDRCPLLNRLPFSAHLLNNNVDAQASSSSTVPNLRKILGEPMEWRDSLKWDHPDTKSTLDPLFGTYDETIFSTFDEEDQLSRKDEERYEMILIKEPSILQELANMLS